MKSNYTRTKYDGIRRDSSLHSKTYYCYIFFNDCKHYEAHQRTSTRHGRYRYELDGKKHLMFAKTYIPKKLYSSVGVEINTNQKDDIYKCHLVFARRIYFALFEVQITLNVICQREFACSHPPIHILPS